MKYCSKCTYPIVAVNLTMSDENICSGCITHDEKLEVDWESREGEFKELLFQYKSKNDNDIINPRSINVTKLKKEVYSVIESGKAEGILYRRLEE